MKVQALQSFEHGGSRRRHAVFEVSDVTGEALAKKGLVKNIDHTAGSATNDTHPSNSKPARGKKEPNSPLMTSFNKDVK